ncbi:MAG: ABC transporter substrate-binding protein [Bifidobacterium scardovii]|uniref:ABC transporter substrate-binding protein n=1 Tax=Bifidobacterium scardovii TaxID=158787 RepID=UPI0029042CA7|nr:ABC transporter substrate-binding protein [Bifidobacterium scardovii]MDU2422646.1 ABC transporter substrate-binding protein [Bifidobacterium scardovii]
MSENNGAHGESGATDDIDNTTGAGNAPNGAGSAPGAGSAASTDASLESRAKTAKQGFNWWVVAVIAIVAVVAVVLGVTLFKPKSDAGGNAAADSGSAAGTVTIGLKLAPTNLDIRNQSGSSLDQVLIGNVYEGLVARDSDNQVVSAIAKSWDESSDGLTYTFHLNSGMTFSNGDALTAEDVVWSINDLIKNQYHDADSLSMVKSVEAQGDDTVVLTLKTPNANLLWTLTGRPGLVLDKDAKYDAKTEAIGSGPYTVSKFVTNDSITFKANDKYWGKNKAKTGTVVVKYLADDNAAVNALKSGSVQVLAPISPNLSSSLDSAKFTVKAGDDTDKYVMAFNSIGAKTSDKRVRQAIRYAINHDELIASRGGADTALGGPIPSLDPGYEDLTGLYPYDLDKAKSLMAEAGYSESKPLELRLTYANTYGTELGDQLRSQLAKIGIDLKVNVVEFSTWLQDVYTNKDYDISLVDHNESHDFYQWATPDYYYNYDNAEVQKLYQQAIASTSDKTRDELLAKAAKIVSEDAPADWLFNYRVTTAWANGVTGFPVNLNQTLLPLYNLAYTPAK